MATKKTPQDHLPAKGENVTVDSPRGPITLKRLTITSGFIRKNRKKNELDLMYDLLEEHADEEALEITDEMTMEEAREFFTEWQQVSGADLGE